MRVLLLIMLAIVVLRAVWLLTDGMLEGFARSSRGSRAPERGVQMVRDPVCGTFVVPERAIALTDRGVSVFFCSAACRDKYRAQRTA